MALLSSLVTPSDRFTSCSPNHRSALDYFPYCAPFPTLSQSLQGDWTFSVLLSELQEEEEEESWRVQVEAVLLGRRKNDRPLEVGFLLGCSVSCCDFSCWLMTIWMSSCERKGEHTVRLRKTEVTPISHLSLQR